jgi:hypothetical protein
VNVSARAPRNRLVLSSPDRSERICGFDFFRGCRTRAYPPEGISSGFIRCNNLVGGRGALRTVPQPLASKVGKQPTAFYLGRQGEEIILIVVSEVTFVIEEKHGVYLISPALSDTPLLPSLSPRCAGIVSRRENRFAALRRCLRLSYF